MLRYSEASCWSARSFGVPQDDIAAARSSHIRPESQVAKAPLALFSHDEQGDGHCLEGGCEDENRQQMRIVAEDVAEQENRNHDDLHDSGEKLADGEFVGVMLFAALERLENLLGESFEAWGRNLAGFFGHWRWDWCGWRRRDRRLWWRGWWLCGGG